MNNSKEQAQQTRYLLSDKGLLREEIVADLLGVTPATVVRWIRKGKLPGRIIRGRSLTSVAALIAWTESGT